MATSLSHRPHGVRLPLPVVGIQDNRVIRHYAINGCLGQLRHMQHVSVHEPSRPV